jgi:XTP/dITP diphosphohydrolase
MTRLIIATTNRGKLREYEEMLGGLDLELEGLGAFDGLNEPVEDGDSFSANAEIKAREYALQTGGWVLADDSGLEVSAMGGAPGVNSARFGGPEADYAQKMRLVLDSLANAADRSARFVCVIAVARPDGSIAATSEGEVRGVIADAPRGSNGFGYDPIFIPEGYTRTFGELTDAEKHSLSHRGRAADEIIRKMLDFIGV